MKNSLQSFLKDNQSILILLPQNPQFDHVASGLGLFIHLQNRYKVSIACPSPMLVEFNRLVGVDKISSELGSKNLVIRIDGYNPDYVENVHYNLDERGLVYFMITPKTNQQPPKREQVQVSYAGIDATTVILIGGSNEMHFPALQSPDFNGVQIIHIGVSEFKSPRSIISLARSASSISEIVASFLKDDPIDSDVATNLLMGMQEGSKSFSTSLVSSETFSLAASLMQSGGKHIPIDRIEKTQFPQGALPWEKQQQTQPPQQAKPQFPQAWLEPKIFKGTNVS